MTPISRPWMGLLAFLVALGLHALLLSGLVLGRERPRSIPATLPFELVTLAPPPVATKPPRPSTPPKSEPARVPPPPPPPAQAPKPEVITKPPPKLKAALPPKARPRPKVRIVRRHKAHARPTATRISQRPMAAKPQVRRIPTFVPAGTAERPADRPPDAFAAYLRNPPPVYPRRARRRHHQGLVLIGVQVSSDGRPLSVELARSCGHKELDRAALAAVKGWRFRPAQRDGRAVAARVEVPVRFRLKKG